MPSSKYTKQSTRTVRRTLLCMLLTISFLVSPLYPFGSILQVHATGLPGWSYFTQLLIDNTQNSNTPTNYQVAVTVNTATLISASYMRSDCGDIRFLDSNNLNQITNYWVEPTTCNTTRTKIWVKIPSLTASTMYPIYMYYGNPSATTLSSTTNTFIDDISGLAAAWNFDEPLDSWNGTSGEVIDSSGNGNNGTDSGFSSNSPVAGKFGNAGSFSGAHDVTVPHATSINNLTNLTYNIWMYPTANPLTSAPERLFDKNGTGNTGPIVYYINDQTVNVTTTWTTTNPYTTTRSPMSIVPLNTWTLITLTFNNSTAKWDIYLNGVKASYPITGGQIAGVGTPIDDSATNLNIGNNAPGSDRAFIGLLDNARIYNVSLTPTQITEEYNNYGYATSNYAGHELIRQYSSPDPVMHALPAAPTSPGNASDSPWIASGNPDGTSQTNVTHYVQFYSKSAVASGKTFTVYMQCNTGTSAAGFNGVSASSMLVDDGLNVLYLGTGTVGACATGNVSTFSSSSFIPITSGTTSAAIAQDDLITITGITATNPNTAATLNAPFIVDIQDNSSTSDEQFVAVPISSTNQLSYTVAIPPWITLGLSTVSTNLGNVVVGVNTASTQPILTTSCNAPAGESVYVYDSGKPSDTTGAVGGLWTVNSSHKIPSVANTGSGTTLTTSVEGYGINGGSGSATSGTFTVQSPYNSGTSTVVGGFLKSWSTLFATSPGPVSGTSTLKISSSVITSTPPGLYIDSITFVAVGAF